MNQLKRVKIENKDGIKITTYRYGVMTVTASIDTYNDSDVIKANFGTDRMPFGKYLHISIFHPSRKANFDEIQEIKKILCGDGFVFQLFPPSQHYLNMFPNMIHIWEIL